MPEQKKKKIIAIVGTTASGKTKIGVDLAFNFNGEIISADSRQVYRGMDIGTGKDLCDFRFLIPDTSAKRNDLQKKKKTKYFNVPYHLIDVVSPNTEFNLAKFYKRAERATSDILSRDKLPIIVGGTGLFTQALVDGYQLNNAKPDMKKREEMEKKTLEKIQEIAIKKYPHFFYTLNESEKGNKRRLARYLEQLNNKQDPFGKKEKKQKYDYLVLGITWPREVLIERIYKRLLVRLEKEDMIGEAERLHKENNVSWKRLESFGLEYKYIALYLQGKIKYDKMVEMLNIAIRQFSKKQLSWLRRWEKQGQEIIWIKTASEAKKIVKKFLKT